MFTSGTSIHHFPCVCPMPLQPTPGSPVPVQALTGLDTICFVILNANLCPFLSPSLPFFSPGKLLLILQDPSMVRERYLHLPPPAPPMQRQSGLSSCLCTSSPRHQSSPSTVFEVPVSLFVPASVLSSLESAGSSPPAFPGLGTIVRIRGAGLTGLWVGSGPLDCVWRSSSGPPLMATHMHHR